MFFQKGLAYVNSHKKGRYPLFLIEVLFWGERCPPYGRDVEVLTLGACARDLVCKQGLWV